LCGIAGIVYSEAGRAVEAHRLAAMGQSLVHRGPDDAGCYVRGPVGLAVRRLAVIDVTGGHQPIHNEARTVWVICNGEIYNFRQLRRALEARGHCFTTRSDTETIVHAYEEYGLDFVAQLRGMFAIALWDERERRLVLARDRLGIKPLHYAALSDRLLFGSEIKALRAADVAFTLDPQALSVYLSLLYIPAPLTIYREVRKLEPGHMLIWQDGRMQVRRYWALGEVEPFPPRTPAAELRQALRETLGEAVRSQLVADVPLGIFLSGGLDSSTVVALARQAWSGRLRTFSVGFDQPSYDERRYARQVAQRFETEHAEIVVRPDAPGLAQRLAAHFDEPFADSSAIPMMFLSALARQHVTVALGGDGGDELFAGYMTYQADKLACLYDRLPGGLTHMLVPALVRRLPVSEDKVSFDFKARRFAAHALLEPGRRHYAWKAFFDDALKQRLLQPDLAAALDGAVDGYPAFHRHYEAVPQFDALTRFQYADTMVYLPDNNLTKVDRTSMAHSLEVRVPLLDERVAEFAFRLPGRLRMPGLRLKHFLRQSVGDLLPAGVRTRPKGGFNVPMSHWLKAELRPLVDHYLSAEVIGGQGYFRPEVVAGLVDEHLAGRADHSRQLWALLMASLWVEQAGMAR
jgi:asparagine synthase (glutamine-hydrolysing)